jgi:phage terminase large subunit GpA-like protein
MPRLSVLIMALVIGNPAALVDEAWARASEPPPKLTVSEWADEFRMVGPPSPEPGPWRTSRTPYLREIMDTLSAEHPARFVTFMKGSQLGGTESGVNWVGYMIDQAPTSMIILLPTQGVTEEWSRVRLASLIERTPVLRGKVLEVARRESGNTLFSKKIAGGLGWIKLAWSSSAAKLRSTPAEFILSDEVDAFEEDADGEGDPIALVEKRFSNFPRGKSFRLSTPATAPKSRIDAEFRKGDQRFFFVPCPHCGHYQALEFKRLRWKPEPVEEERPENRADRCASAAYVCRECSKPIEERFKPEMLAAGIWVATASDPELREVGFADTGEIADIREAMESARRASFHLSSLYSPVGWYSWAQLAEDWEVAKRDVRRLKVFVMTALAEVWVDKGEAPDATRLFERRENYERGVVPSGGLFLTGGVDVQKDRLEVEVVAWGPRKESWSIDYVVIEGDTSGEKVWNELGELLGRDWRRANGGTLPIQVLAVDTGYRAPEVYEFTKKHPQAVFSSAGWRVPAPRTVVPIKGGSDHVRIIERYTSADAARRRRGVKLVTVGTAAVKEQLYSWLRFPVPTTPGESYPPGFCHFPSYEIGWFQGLTSESRVVRKRGRFEWVRHSNVRNEALDCRVYARAAATIFGIDEFTDEHWKRLGWNADRIAVVPKPEEPKRRARRDDGDDWLGGRGGDWF